MDNRLRLVFDTNIYGLIIDENEELLLKAQTTSKVIIYGFDVIRKELRNTPTNLKQENKNYRGLLLAGYDNIVKNHSYVLTPIMETLAREYLEEYDGGISKDKMWNDFLIVACSSIHTLDIIVSEDNHSMRSSPAVRAYKKVNEKNQLREPVFYSIKELDKLL